jgi:hypothetical protein
MSYLVRELAGDEQHVGRKREALLDRKPGCTSEARSRRASGILPERGPSEFAP